MTANGAPEIVSDLIRAHVQYIHCLAGSLVGQGKVIVAGFGEDPTQPDPTTGKLGRRLSPRVLHSDVGDEKQTLIDIRQILKLRHYNVYMPLAIFRPNLREGSKGYERDVVACLGIVADFDDPEAAQWEHRLPIAPNYVIETSAGRFQAFFLFDKPEALDVVKPVAERLKVFAKCDHGTSDMSHVWRVPGALNWPNAKKVGEGRALDPQLVRVAKPWDLGTISLQALSDALPEVEPGVTPKKTKASAPKNKKDTGGGHSPHRAAVDGSLENLTALVELQALPPELQEEIKQAATGDRSKALFRVIRKMLEAGLDNLAIETIIEAHPKGIGEKYAGRKGYLSDGERH